MNFKDIVEKARELSSSDSLSSLFNGKQRKILKGTIDVMERAVNKVHNWQNVKFKKRDDLTTFLILNRMSEYLRMSIGVKKELKEFIQAYQQLSSHYTSCRGITGDRSPILKQAATRLYELIQSRKSAISASLKERMN